jgi:hypothetical protein
VWLTAIVFLFRQKDNAQMFNANVLMFMYTLVSYFRNTPPFITVGKIQFSLELIIIVRTIG